MKKHIYNQIDNNLSDTEQFIIKINDIKTNMGMWYSLFLRRILPFLIYIIPMNVVLENSYNTMHVLILLIQSVYQQSHQLQG